MTVIQTHNLTKVYKGRTDLEFQISGPPKMNKIPETRALSNLDLTVEKGEIFGYLGPNGAGKTTTIRLLLDLIRPTEGEASILGQDVNENSVELHRHIGFLPGELSLWKDRTGMQVVKYIAQVRGGSNDVQEAQVLAERLKLDLSKKVRDYSSGNKRKLGVVLAFMHKPEVLILDEPTGGLDPLIQQSFYEMVREAKNEGRTIFLSSHVLSEVQAICDRVGILREGKLRAVESIAKLTHTEFRWIKAVTREPVDVAVFNGIEGISDVNIDGTELNLRLHGDFDPVLRALSSHYVLDLQTQDPSLEEIFLTFYGNNKN